MVRAMDPTKPKVETVTTEVDKDDPKVREANELLIRAARPVTPFGTNHVGSVALHYFESKDGNVHTYQMVMQTMVDNVSEGFCDHGLKKLRKRLMKKYGRETSKTN